MVTSIMALPDLGPGSWRPAAPGTSAALLVWPAPAWQSSTTFGVNAASYSKWWNCFQRKQLSSSIWVTMWVTIWHAYVVLLLLPLRVQLRFGI